jgi:hypothetical protein
MRWSSCSTLSEQQASSKQTTDNVLVKICSDRWPANKNISGKCADDSLNSFGVHLNGAIALQSDCPRTSRESKSAALPISAYLIRTGVGKKQAWGATKQQTSSWQAASTQQAQIEHADKQTANEQQTSRNQTANMRQTGSKQGACRSVQWLMARQQEHIRISRLIDVGNNLAHFKQPHVHALGQNMYANKMSWSLVDPVLLFVNRNIMH